MVAPPFVDIDASAAVSRSRDRTRPTSPPFRMKFCPLASAPCVSSAKSRAFGVRQLCLSVFPISKVSCGRKGAFHEVLDSGSEDDREGHFTDSREQQLQA